MITLENVTKTYSGETTIGPINVEIPSGGITSLVGPNGAGKSTVLTMMGRLLSPDNGKITVGGLDVSKAKSNDVAKKLSILRQENHFVTRLTVRQLIGFGRYPHSQGRLTVDDEVHINKALDFLNLTALQDRYLDELSGGQRQRAYVAMVLAQDTEYMFLDEPLNNLDMSHSVQMMRQLRAAADELGRTVIIVMHDINFASRYSDNILAMNDGVVTHFDSCADTMKSSVLSEIFGTSVRIIDDVDGPLAVYF